MTDTSKPMEPKPQLPADPTSDPDYADKLFERMDAALTTLADGLILWREFFKAWRDVVRVERQEAEQAACRRLAANLPPEMVEMACITFYGPEDWRSFETWEQANTVRDMRAAISAALAQVGEKKDG